MTKTSLFPVLSPLEAPRGPSRVDRSFRYRPSHGSNFGALRRKFLWCLVVASSPYFRCKQFERLRYYLPSSFRFNVVSAVTAADASSYCTSFTIPTPCQYRLHPSELPPNFLSSEDDNGNNKNSNELLYHAVHAVRRACAATILLAHDRKMDKADKTVVTAADYASQAIVLGMLHKHCGNIVNSYIAEESSGEISASEERDVLQSIVQAVGTAWPDFFDSQEMEAEEAAEAVCQAIDLGTTSREYYDDRPYWVVDPIDGTDGFVSGGQYCVALALIQNGDVQLGVLGCPRLPYDNSDHSETDGNSRHESNMKTGFVIVAAKGRGCYILPLSYDAHDPTGPRLLRINLPISLSGKGGNGIPLRICTGARSSRVDPYGLIDGALNRLSPKYNTSVLKTTSQCKYAMIATSQCHAFLKLPREDYAERSWDHAAGWLIVREAGGIVSDGRGNQNLTLSSNGKAISTGLWGVLASCGEKVHNDILWALSCEVKQESG